MVASVWNFFGFDFKLFPCQKFLLKIIAIDNSLIAD